MLQHLPMKKRNWLECFDIYLEEKVNFLKKKLPNYQFSYPRLFVEVFPLLDKGVNKGLKLSNDLVISKFILWFLWIFLKSLKFLRISACVLYHKSQFYWFFCILMDNTAFLCPTTTIFQYFISNKKLLIIRVAVVSS